MVEYSFSYFTFILSTTINAILNLVFVLIETKGIQEAGNNWFKPCIGFEYKVLTHYYKSLNNFKIYR